MKGLGSFQHFLLALILPYVIVYIYFNSWIYYFLHVTPRWLVSGLSSPCCRLTRSATPCSACSPTWRRVTRGSSGGPGLVRMRMWVTPPPVGVWAPGGRDSPPISDGHHLFLYISNPLKTPICDLIYTTYVYLLKCYTMESSTVNHVTYHVYTIRFKFQTLYYLICYSSHYIFPSIHDTCRL